MSATWRDKYAYVLPYALQSRRVTIHLLPPEGAYWPPGCIGAQHRRDAILVLREHMDAIGATVCKRCEARKAGGS